MKRLAILTMSLLLVTFTASAQSLAMFGRGEATLVGTFHAQDMYANNKDVVVNVWAYSLGTIYLDAQRWSYILTTKDRDALLPLTQQGVRYCQIAKDNSTTIDFGKKVGEFNTEDGARVVVNFTTKGWEHSGVQVWIYEAGQNVALFFTTQDIADMAKALSAVAETTSDYSRQVALFN